MAPKSPMYAIAMAMTRTVTRRPRGSPSSPRTFWIGRTTSGTSEMPASAMPTARIVAAGTRLRVPRRRRRWIATRTRTIPTARPTRRRTLGMDDAVSLVRRFARSSRPGADPIEDQPALSERADLSVASRSGQGAEVRVEEEVPAQVAPARTRRRHEDVPNPFRPEICVRRGAGGIGEEHTGTQDEARGLGEERCVLEVDRAPV